MKECEKWLKKDSRESGIQYDLCHNIDCRKGWRGALEMVLNDLLVHCATCDEVEERIKEELEA